MGLLGMIVSQTLFAADLLRRVRTDSTDSPSESLSRSIISRTDIQDVGLAAAEGWQECIAL
jgi:hypothetical protein